ncbi:MAG: RNA-guided pseudouridylation complex pseudouridine synthase subunit Cbf5 [Candidatus Diapherotrites archaeon]|nr:RNA-guided pseudouridylation complex pseudouridine synthase subunit Cbf5 [Candidatus Diapherotrites archaeon]
MIEFRKETPIKHDFDRIKCSFVAIDKPAGPSSHEVTAWVKKILDVKKAGHAGTLDPNVTGVLPIAIGKATKLLQALAKCDKEYVCIAKFDRQPDNIEQYFKEFTGKFYQTPPKESAVKKRMRVRRIYELRILEKEDTRVLFYVKCQHGTYIRTLCSDIGEVMGNPCKMEELRRIRAGPFDEKDCCTLHELKDFGPERCLLPPEKGVSHLKRMIVSNNAVSAVCHGANLAKAGVVAIDENIEKGEMIALMTVSNELIGLGKALKSTNEIVESKKGFVCSPISIIMPKDIYPKKWKHG